MQAHLPAVSQDDGQDCCQAVKQSLLCNYWNLMAFQTIFILSDELKLLQNVFVSFNSCFN